MKNYWELSKNLTEEKLLTSGKGLTQEEVTKRQDKYGYNRLEEGKKRSIFGVFLHQFADLLVIILLVAAVISAFSGNMESTLVIIAVLLLNAVLGTVQHVKAEKSLDSLKQLSSPSVKVIREGKKIEISSVEIVPGDLVLLEAGDMVVADGRIVANYSLQVNESSLTGESINIDKTDEVLEGELALGDRKNMVFSGSLVTYGRAEVYVTHTGMNTEIGKIARLMNQVMDRKTPLQKSMDDFSKKLAVFVVLISLLVLGLSLYRKMPIMDALMFAVALAVAAIPEALSSIVTIVQAMGTQKMARENAIIKELKAVESLGCVSVICSDKTGTLTQNKMTVKKLYVAGEELLPGEELGGVILQDYAVEKEGELADDARMLLLYNAVLNNDSSIINGKGIGDPTEYALLEMFGAKSEEVVERLRETFVRKEEIAFDSDRKLMSAKYEIGGENLVFTKGALDVLLARCTKIHTGTEIRSITEEDKSHIEEINQSYSMQGLRVLTYAYRMLDTKLTKEEEKDFIFLGLTAMVDPPRPEAVAAVADAKMAGIRPVMITGDHKITAVAIAKEIGIYSYGDLALTGVELDAMSDEELEACVDRISVYARVSPENKIRIVQAWQKKGCIVSMTGDGVNDAPALKKADIGVAMGITGTEVAKDASAMILADDNFATIIKAVVNGRNVYRNIRNAILFLLSGNMAAILAVLATSLLGLSVPFAPVHLLFINLLTDSLPAIAIGMEGADDTLLKQKPRNPKEGLLTGTFFRGIIGQGCIIAIGVLAAYALGLQADGAKASTMAFATLTLARLFHGFNCRSPKSILKIGLLSNKVSVYAFLLGVVLLAAVLFIPGLTGLFAVSALSAMDILVILGLALLPTIVIQFGKMIYTKGENL